MSRNKESIFNKEIIKKKMQNIDNSLTAWIVALCGLVLLAFRIYPLLFMSFADMVLHTGSLVAEFPSLALVFNIFTFVLIYLIFESCRAFYYCIGNIYRLESDIQKKKELQRKQKQEQEQEQAGEQIEKQNEKDTD